MYLRKIAYLLLAASLGACTQATDNSRATDLDTGSVANDTMPVTPPPAGGANHRAANALTDAEKAAGWQLLFDGKTTNGWRGAYMEKFPAGGWRVENGTIGPVESGGAESRNGGDIVTTGEYDISTSNSSSCSPTAPTAA
jgi:hypothetical protein